MTREIMVAKVIARFGFESTETIEFCTYVEKYENYSGYLAEYMLKTLFDSLMEKSLDD
jgi:hypothetical protein